MHDRIVIDPSICHGKPVIRGARTPVTVILNALAGGDGFETQQSEYSITADDIRACIAFASEEVGQMSWRSSRELVRAECIDEKLGRAI